MDYQIHQTQWRVRMDHQMSVPSSIWKWAIRKSGNTNPASYLRNILMQHIAEENGSKDVHQNNTTKTAVKKNTIYLHSECYNKMVDETEDVTSFPSATPFESSRMSQCPRCKKIIMPGEVTVATNPREELEEHEL